MPTLLRSVSPTPTPSTKCSPPGGNVTAHLAQLGMCVSPTPRQLHSQGHIEIPSVVFLTTPFLFVSGRKRLLAGVPDPVSRTSSCRLLRPLDPSCHQEGGSFQTEEMERVKPARGTQTPVQCGPNPGHVKPSSCPERWVKGRSAEPGTASGSDCTWHPWEQGALGSAEGPGQGRAQALSPAARADKVQRQRQQGH